MEQLPEWFAKAWTAPQSVKIMGFPSLKPFSLHHVIRLGAIQSPFLDGLGRDATLEDLEMACLICSTTFGDDVKDTINEHYFNKTNKNAKQWRKDIAKALKDHTYFYRQCCLFSEYMKSYQTFAPTYESLFPSTQPNKVNTMSIPWMLSLVAKMLMETSLCEQEIMDMAFSKLVGFSHAIDYRQSGETKILSSGDILAIRCSRGELSYKDVISGKV